MKDKELPENVAAKVHEWMGDHSVPHFWESEGTFYVLARCSENLHCLRVFPIGDHLELSQDNIIYG